VDVLAGLHVVVLESGLDSEGVGFDVSLGKKGQRGKYIPPKKSRWAWMRLAGRVSVR
jgi:hypothetical protein